MNFLLVVTKVLSSTVSEILGHIGAKYALIFTVFSEGVENDASAGLKI